MYFPTSLKLVVAVLASALVAHAVPELTHTVIVKQIGEKGDGEPWKAGSGRAFNAVSDYDEAGELNPDTDVYHLYKPEFWTYDHNGGEVFALTTENGEVIDSSESKLHLQGTIIKTGYDQDERYWVVFEKFN